MPNAEQESYKRLKEKTQQHGAITMTRKAARKNEKINSNFGEIVLYESEDGQAALDVHLQDETVWLTQAQMEKLFQRDQSVISRHVNNIFKEGELQRLGNIQKMHIANSDKPVAFYNLDIIISVGYRVKSQRGTQFRIWATTILKDHLVCGYSLNQRRLAEKGVEEKASHLLYFVIKDHPFTDGNKRIGSFLFLLFLKKNGLLDQKSFSNKALVALALLTAASEPWQKELMIRLIVNLISEEG